MSLKLVTIGDSISQGFMSGAAARTDLCYSTLLARAMGLNPTSTDTGSASDYLIPAWPCDGLPVNLEAMLRRVARKAGGRIDFFDWPLAFQTVASAVDQVEDCYERGEAAPSRPFGTTDGFHNLAVQGYDVADAWQVTPTLCLDQIKLKESHPPRADDILQPPSASFYRTAYNVLNPQRDPGKNDWSSLDWLKHMAETQGIENLILWLGANNALGTVISLTVRATNGPGSTYRSDMTRPERDENFNLWSPDHFATDYVDLLERVEAALAGNVFADWKVFVGTVPAVSIAPLAKGVGESYDLDDPFGVIKGKAAYSKYYTYALFDEDYAQKGGKKLGVRDIYSIDSYIAGYNKTIKRETTARNTAMGQSRYHIVDICEVLLKAAWKRNNGAPTYDWPKGVTNHFPMVDTRFYHATEEGTLEQGGLFSMDGIHPTAIGQGLIAHEFREVINAARPKAKLAPLDWDAIFASDTLYQSPIRIMPSIRASDDGAKLILSVMASLDRVRKIG